MCLQGLCVNKTHKIGLGMSLQVLGHSSTLAYETWPSYDEALLVEDTVNLPVQVSLLSVSVNITTCYAFCRVLIKLAVETEAFGVSWLVRRR